MDFHVRLENDEFFMVEAFDSQTEDPDSAHLTTFRSDNWKAVEAFVRDFNPKTKLPESGYGDRCGHWIVG